jgi:hypothetical protein
MNGLVKVEKSIADKLTCQAKSDNKTIPANCAKSTPSVSFYLNVKKNTNQKTISSVSIIFMQAKYLMTII